MQPAGPTVVLVAAALLVCVWTPSAARQRRQEPTRVLLLFQQQAETQPMVEFTQRLRLTIRNDLASPVEFFQEALDLDRFRGSDRSSSLARYLDDKYRGFGIDVVVPVGGRALRFAADYLRDVFPSVPIVFALATAPQVNRSALPSNVTGRLAGASRFTPTISMARALQPDAERIVVVGGAGATDSVSVSAARSAVAALGDTLQLIVLQGLSLDTLLVTLHRVSRRSIVLFANFRQDGNGQVFDPHDIVGSLARASAAPMYAQLRSYIGEGPVGGSVLSFADEGARTGQLIARVLGRRPGEPMPPAEITDKSFVADWRELRRWGLSDKRLPPGTELLFREPTLWQRYRLVVVVTLGVIVAELLLIGGLLLERRRRQRAQLLVTEQAAFERTMAGLTADAARHAPDDAPRALEDALARVATYADATAASLVQYAETSTEPATSVFWTAGADKATGRDSSPATPFPPMVSGARLGVPLMADGTPIGALELYRNGNGRAWPAALVRRIEAAGEIIASAMARARAARTIEQTRRQVAHMGRVAIVGELAAAVSHELRQPLAAIRANAEAGTLLLRQSPPEVNEAREAFMDIIVDDVRASEIIDHIRTLLRKQEPTTTSVDLNDICRGAVHLLHRDAVIRGTRLDLSLAPALPPLSGDPIQLQQVVLNLALNALDAATTSPAERRVAIATARRSAEVELSVRDSGRGLPPEVQQRLFESFFSTKAHGLGMGLVIVRSIVERHNGRVHAENHSSGGAIFRVLLPTGQS